MNAERARLFVALELPRQARTTLTRWRDGQLNGVAGLAPVDPEALHATLCFIGSRPVAEITLIAAACETLATQRQLVLSFGEILWLPPRRPRVVAVKLEDRDDHLRQLQTRLSERLQTGGWYAPASRPFLGHVTLARVVGGARVRAGGPTGPFLLRLPAGRSPLESANGPAPPEFTAGRSPLEFAAGPAPLEFTAGRITLFRSVLGRPRVRYERLATVDLQTD